MTNTYNYCFSNLTNDLFMSKMKNAAYPPSFTEQIWFGIVVLIHAMMRKTNVPFLHSSISHPRS